MEENMPDKPSSAGTSPELPSVWLSRLAELTAADLSNSAGSGGAANPLVLTEQAPSDVCQPGKRLGPTVVTSNTADLR